jgi:hypothetical protein
MKTLLQAIIITKIYPILGELSKNKGLRSFNFWVEKRKGLEMGEA